MKLRPSSVLSGSNWNSLAVWRASFSPGTGLSVMNTWQDELFATGLLSSLLGDAEVTLATGCVNFLMGKWWSVLIQGAPSAH